MNVLRLGYVHIAVTELAAASTHYGEILGMAKTAASNGTEYFKGWDEWDHHSIAITEGDGGLVKMGWKVRRGGLEDLERSVHSFGATTERMTPGENVAVGDGFRCVTPSGHIAEFYEDIDVVGTEMGTVNPDPWPRAGLRGVGVPRLSHTAVTADDTATSERFFTEALGFHATERAVPAPDGEPIVTFLSCGEAPHDIAIQKGPDGRMHHVAFEIPTWGDVLRAGDVLSMSDVPIDVGPTRHGITRGQTLYFFDPTGNRNEVFTGGYRTGPDMPCITWTAEELARGVFYISRELPEQFTTALT
jgi:catechol 2,3-dioxygenase